jgi:hypothetical protein
MSGYQNFAIWVAGFLIGKKIGEEQSKTAKTVIDGKNMERLLGGKMTHTKYSYPLCHDSFLLKNAVKPLLVYEMLAVMVVKLMNQRKVCGGAK